MIPVMLVYAFGSIFFLFWKEPFIKYELILGFAVLSTFDYLTKSQKSDWQKWYKKADPYLSLMIHAGLIYYYVTWFMK